MIDRKKAAMGEGVFMIYRLLLVSILAFTIFGVSSIFYDYEIEVRDAEAVILTRQVSDCLATDGVLRLDEIGEAYFDDILSYCGMSGAQRFYVNVKVYDGSESLIAEFSQGDSGSDWVKRITAAAGRYNPGQSELNHSVLVARGISEIEGRMELEVIINHEF